MNGEHRVGAVHWIDHHVVPTNDMTQFCKFMENVLGGTAPHWLPMTTKARIRRAPIGVFYKVGRYHSNGGFLQEKMLPPTAGMGVGIPRVGYFVRTGDLDDHLRRLDENNVLHTDPEHTSEEGHEGTTVYFQDSDGNQYEFWAPKNMPAGAMESDNPLGVGRLSHIVYESRDLSKTAEFFMRFCGVDPIQTADVARDTLALELKGGGRLIYKKVAQLNERTGGHNIWKGQHAALTVAADEFMPAYQCMWENLAESDYKPYSSDKGIEVDEKQLPPRTELHGLIALFGSQDAQKDRGSYFYDWDDNAFHLSGGKPLDSTMAHYRVTYDFTAEKRPTLDEMGRNDRP